MLLLHFIPEAMHPKQTELVTFGDGKRNAFIYHTAILGLIFNGRIDFIVRSITVANRLISCSANNSTLENLDRYLTSHGYELIVSE
jgi:hypothetical protein